MSERERKGLSEKDGATEEGGGQVMGINVSGAALARSAHPQDTSSRKREKVRASSLIPDQ